MSQPGSCIVSSPFARRKWAQAKRVFSVFVTAAVAFGLAAAGCASKEAKPEIKLPPGPLGVAPIQISWAYQNTVESNNIYGYNIYRSTSRDADFEKVNDDLVVPTPEDPNPDFVVFEDKGLPLGETYYYYVEAVTQDGKRHKATIVYPLRVTREMAPEEVKAWKTEQTKKARAEKKKSAE